MNHSYSQYMNRLEGERARRAYVADQTLAAAAIPVPQAPWDGQKNSELIGLIQHAPIPGPDAEFIKKQVDVMTKIGNVTAQLDPFAMPLDARQIDKTARAALHTTTTDELRTEGHQIKHRTNPHE